MEKYEFPNQFKCMYCRHDLDVDNTLLLGKGDAVDLSCSDCGATWKFWASIQLNQRLVRGGKYNKTKEPLVKATP